VNPITGRRADQVSGQEKANSGSSAPSQPGGWAGTSLDSPQRPIWEPADIDRIRNQDFPDNSGAPEPADGDGSRDGQPFDDPMQDPAAVTPPGGESNGIRHLAKDSQAPVWRRRLIIAVVVGVVFTILLSWRVGLTLAVLAAIADAVIRSRKSSSGRSNGFTSSAQRRTKKQLDQLERSGYRSLHMRVIPGSEEVIDHLLIGPTGVYSIDSEQWDKGLPVRTRNGRQLWHGPFSQKERLQHAHWEAAQASERIGRALGEPVSVHPAMAVYGPPIPWGVATIRDVDVFSGDKLRKYLRKRPGVSSMTKLTASDIERIYTAAERTLPAKH
jgi:Nuclease-related domain